MIESMLLEYNKLHKQRALLLSVVLSIMCKEFEDDAVNLFKISLAKQIVDVMFKKGDTILLEDEAEKIVLKSILTFMEKETLLLNIKNILEGDQPL